MINFLCHNLIPNLPPCKTDKKIPECHSSSFSAYHRNLTVSETQEKIQESAEKSKKFEFFIFQRYVIIIFMFMVDYVEFIYKYLNDHILYNAPSDFVFERDLQKALLVVIYYFTTLLRGVRGLAGIIFQYRRDNSLIYLVENTLAWLCNAVSAIGNRWWEGWRRRRQTESEAKALLFLPLGFLVISLPYLLFSPLGFRIVFLILTFFGNI